MMKLARAATLLLAPSLLLFAREASAAPPPDPCNPDLYTCVTVSNVTIGKSVTNPPFQNGLNTGWISCKSSNKCSDGPGNCSSTIDACLDAEMSDSRIDVNMTGFWDVSWPEVGKLKITPRKKTNAGTYAVTYKLSPLFGVYINALGFKSTVVLDPLSILNALMVPDVNGGFDYTAMGSCVFDPWAWTPISCPISGAPQNLFTLPLSQLTGLAGLDTGKYIEVSVGLEAGTDTTFTWQTKQLLVDNGSMPITGTNYSTDIPYDGSATVQVNVWGVGDVGYNGTTDLKPDIEVDSVAGFKFSPPLKFAIGTLASVPFMGTIPNIALKKTLISIPLPVINLDAKEMNFGDVPVGTSISKKLTIHNDGKLMLTTQLATTPTGGVFKPSMTMANITDGSMLDVSVAFAPTKAGAATGTLTVNSNDPDNPTYTIVLKGNGTEEPGAAGSGGSGGTGGAPPVAGSGGSGGMIAAAGKGGMGGSAGSLAAVDPGNPEVGSTGGCGCRTAGEENGAPLGLAGLGLGLAVLVSRRKKHGLSDASAASLSPP